MRTSRLSLLLAVGIAPLSAQLALVSRPVPPADAVERGQKAFVASCGFCHGANAKGGESGPDLVRSPIVLDDENGDHIGPVIQKGRPDRGMPSFSLPQPQISDIAAFLRARTQAAIDRRAYIIQNLVTGNAKAGEQFFRGAGQCSGCHSPTGDLAKVGTRYPLQVLQSRFLYPRGGTRKPTQVTVTPRSGPPMTGELEFQDDFTVGLRNSEGYYLSYARDSVKIDIRDPYAAHADLLRKYTDADMHNMLAYLVTLK